jgi:hypothetical protein
MSDDYKKYFSQEARDARRASKLGQFSAIKGSIGHAKVAEFKLTTQNAGLKAVSMVREILNNYHLPGLPKLSYSGIRNGRTAANSSRLEDGVITVNASFRSTSGVGISFDIPIEISGGKLLEPSVIVHNGEPRIIAQSAFDGIVVRNTFKDYVPVRDLYAAPLDKNVASQLYTNRTKQTAINQGIFSVHANRENLRRAIRGQELIQEEPTDTTHEAASSPVKRPKPPKTPKAPGLLKPPMPTKLKSKPSKSLCSKCNHSPCVCPNKRKKKAEMVVRAEIARLEGLTKTAQSDELAEIKNMLNLLQKKITSLEKGKSAPANQTTPAAPAQSAPAGAPAAPASNKATPPPLPSKKKDPAKPAGTSQTVDINEIDPSAEESGFAAPSPANMAMSNIMKAVGSIHTIRRSTGPCLTRLMKQPQSQLRSSIHSFLKYRR